MSKRTFKPNSMAEIPCLSVWYISTRGEKERIYCVGDVCGRVQRMHRGLSRTDTGQLHWLANKQHKVHLVVSAERQLVVKKKKVPLRRVMFGSQSPTL